MMDRAEPFADSVLFSQIFGGVEDTHKTLPVKKASQRTEKKKEEKDEEEEEEEEEEVVREGDERRSSSVYDSRSSLRRWVNYTTLISPLKMILRR